MLARDESSLKRTPLHALHVARGGKLVPFAGYEMPVQYPAGVLKEHLHTRASAGLFDVSHMGQLALRAKSGKVGDAALALERLVPQDIVAVAPGRQRYAQFTNADGGILDDLMVANFGDHLFLVVNAACKAEDEAHLRAHLSGTCVIDSLADRGLVALQGPKAEAVLAKHAPQARTLAFMYCTDVEIGGIRAQVSRSGYTGEDGFEISVSNADAPELWTLLLSDPLVKPVGLGARDSLRLEGGLCLYGHELDETISPVEADLVWSIGKRRRTEGGFIGAGRVLKELAEGVTARRVGIKPEGRAPAREGTVITDQSGREIGKVTSGGFGPTVGGPIAMGYVEAQSSVPGTPVNLIVRGTAMPAQIVKLPFIPNRFKR
jgi:aminomethyltransferase